MLSSHEESDEDLPGEGVLESPVEFSTPTRARRPAVDRAPPVSTPQRSPLLKGKARPLTIQSPSGGPMLPFLSPPHYSGGASRPPMELRPRLTDRLRRPVSHGFYKGALEDPEGDVLSRVSSGFLSPTPSAARRNPLASLRDMRGMAFDMPRGGAASVPLPDVASSWGRGGARSVAGRSRMVSAAEASLAAALSASLGRDHAVADEGGGEDAGAKAWDQLLERNKTTLVVTKLGAQGEKEEPRRVIGASNRLLGTHTTSDGQPLHRKGKSQSVLMAERMHFCRTDHGRRMLEERVAHFSAETEDDRVAEINYVAQNLERGSNGFYTYEEMARRSLLRLFEIDDHRDLTRTRLIHGRRSDKVFRVDRYADKKERAEQSVARAEKTALARTMASKQLPLLCAVVAAVRIRAMALGLLRGRQDRDAHERRSKAISRVQRYYRQFRLRQTGAKIQRAIRERRMSQVRQMEAQLAISPPVPPPAKISLKERADHIGKLAKGMVSFEKGGSLVKTGSGEDMAELRRKAYAAEVAELRRKAHAYARVQDPSLDYAPPDLPSDIEDTESDTEGGTALGDPEEDGARQGADKTSVVIPGQLSATSTPARKQPNAPWDAADARQGGVPEVAATQLARAGSGDQSGAVPQPPTETLGSSSILASWLNEGHASVKRDPDHERRVKRQVLVAWRIHTTDASMLHAAHSAKASRHSSISGALPGGADTAGAGT